MAIAEILPTKIVQITSSQLDFNMLSCIVSYDVYINDTIAQTLALFNQSTIGVVVPSIATIQNVKASVQNAIVAKEQLDLTKDSIVF